MKKFLFSIIVLIFIVIAEIFFQVLPYSLRPNLWLAYIVFAVLFLTHKDAIVISFIFGMFYDILHLTVFGVNTIVFSSIGYFCGWLNKHVNEASLKVQILVFVLCVVLYFILYYFILFLLKTHKFGFHQLISIFPTTIVGVLVIQLLQKFYNLYILTE